MSSPEFHWWTSESLGSIWSCVVPQLVLLFPFHHGELVLSFSVLFLLSLLVFIFSLHHTSGHVTWAVDFFNLIFLRFCIFVHMVVRPSNWSIVWTNHREARELDPVEVERDREIEPPEILLVPQGHTQSR